MDDSGKNGPGDIESGPVEDGLEGAVSADSGKLDYVPRSWVASEVATVHKRIDKLEQNQRARKGRISALEKVTKEQNKQLDQIAALLRDIHAKLSDKS